MIGYGWPLISYGHVVCHRAAFLRFAILLMYVNYQSVIVNNYCDNDIKLNFLISLYHHMWHVCIRDKINDQTVILLHLLGSVLSFIPTILCSSALKICQLCQLSWSVYCNWLLTEMSINQLIDWLWVGNNQLWACCLCHRAAFLWFAILLMYVNYQSVIAHFQ